MALIAESKRKNLWFGTLDRMEFFPTPNRGADVSPHGWVSEGTLLNGGGFQLSSFDSHRVYVFEWPTSSARQVAQMMKSYSDGTYGRGLIYFVDPLAYDTNTLPARWADPSMTIGVEGSSLVYGVEPTDLPTGGGHANNLPVRTAFYDLLTISDGWRGNEQAVFLPIPEGFDLLLGSFHTQSGAGRVMYRPQSSGGGLGAVSEITPLPLNSPTVSNERVPGSGLAGVWLFVGKNAPGAGSVSLTAMSARLVRQDRASDTVNSGPWIGGQGHSGCRFAGKPTYFEHTGVDGGQVSFAATFREVGSWLHG